MSAPLFMRPVSSSVSFWIAIFLVRMNSLILIELAMMLMIVPTIRKMMTLIKSICQISYGFTLYIQSRNTADAAISSMVMKTGLSIMNTGAIRSSAMNIVAGISGLFCVIRHAKKNRSDIDRYIMSCAISESFFIMKNKMLAMTE